MWGGIESDGGWEETGERKWKKTHIQESMMRNR